MRNAVVAFLVLFLLAFCAERQNNPGHQAVDLSRLQPKYPTKGEILFQSDMDGEREIFLLTSQGIKQLTDKDWDVEYPKWSRDGNGNTWLIHPDGSNKVRLTKGDETAGSFPSWSEEQEYILSLVPRSNTASTGETGHSFWSTSGQRKERSSSIARASMSFQVEKSGSSL